MSMPPLPTMHRIEWSVMIPGASSSGHLTVVGDPALPSTIAEVTDYARRRLVDGDSLDEVIVEIFDPDTSRTLFHGRVGPEPITMQVDRRLLALFPLDDGSTLQVLGTASDGYRLARCPAGEDSDPDGARYFGELGTAVAAAVELAGIEIPHPNPGGTNPMNDRDPFGRDDHLGDPSLPDGPVPEVLEQLPDPAVICSHCRGAGFIRKGNA